MSRKKRDWKKPLSKGELLYAIGEYSKLPFVVLEEMTKLKTVYRSPSSFSFYSNPKEWGYTENETLRYSNHWNFLSYRTGGKIHSITNIPVPENTWAKAIYDSSTGIFNVLEIYVDAKLTTKQQYKQLKEIINPGNLMFKPSEEFIEKRRRFKQDVLDGNVIFLGKRVIKISKLRIDFEDGSSLNRRINGSTITNFRKICPEFCITINGMNFSEENLYSLKLL